MYYTRYLENQLMHAKSQHKVKLLLGPRQAGKTSLLDHCLSEKSAVTRINLQDRWLRLKYERDAAVFLQELALLGRGTIGADRYRKSRQFSTIEAF